jgi:hypothetical protein
MKPPLNAREPASARDAEEAAAAIAAVLALLDAERSVMSTESLRSTPGWRATARAVVQGLPPIRLPVAPSWGRIERLRRAGRGSSGVVGQ